MVPHPDDHAVHSRQKRLAQLVAGFLEEKLELETLKAAPEKIERLRRLLEENLWQGVIPQDDPYWQFSDDWFDPDNPDLYDPELAGREWADFGANSLIFFHNLLKNGVWEPFKAGILAHQQRLKAVEQWPQEGELAELTDLIDRPSCSMVMGKIPLRLPETMEISYSLEEGDIHVFTASLSAVQTFLDLLNGLPVSIFGTCKAPDCGRWFIFTTRHTREFCSRNCAARYHQQEVRRTDPEGYKAYQKAQYQLRKSRQRLSAEDH